MLISKCCTVCTTTLQVALFRDAQGGQLNDNFHLWSIVHEPQQYGAFPLHGYLVYTCIK